MTKPSANQQGITIIELLLSVAIVLTLSVMSTSYYSKALLENAVADTSDRFVGELRKAQLYSILGKENTSWGVRYGSNRITLFASSSAAFDEIFSVNSNVAVSGFTQVVFSRVKGLPDSTPTIVLTGGNDTENIVINSLGAILR